MREIIRTDCTMSEYLQDQVKSWVTMDNDIRDMADRIKSARDDKSEVQSNITDYIRENNMENSVIRISDSDIRFTTTRTAAPLTYKHLYTCLCELVADEEQVQRMITHIKEKRPIKENMDMKRTFRDI